MRIPLLGGFCCLVGLSGLLPSAQGDGPARPAVARASVSAPNPRLSVTVEHAGLAEVAAALSKASGIDVRPRYGKSRRADDDTPRISFRWVDVPFFDALRQLCDGFRVRCRRDPLGYRLEPALEIDRPRRNAGGAWVDRKLGVTARPLGAVWDRPNLPAPPLGSSTREAATVALEFEFDRTDAGRVMGLGNVAAQDDRGNLLTFREPAPSRSPESSPYANYWFGDVEFPYADPRAHRLNWLQGDLMGYRDVWDSRVAFPFQTEHPFPMRFAKWSGEIECARERSRNSPGAFGGLGGAQLPKGPYVDVRLHTEDAVQDSRHQVQVSVELIGKSGTAYLPQGTQWSIIATEAEQQSYFPAIDEPIAEVHVGFQEMSGVSRLLTFRLTNIPLPTAPPRSREVGDASAPGSSISAEVTFTVVNADAAPAGSVSVGLQRQLGPGWTPIRWRRAELDEHGQARLTDLPAGLYRITRHYQPPKPLPTAGRWSDEIIVVKLLVGQSTTLPPLRWVTSP